VAANRPQILSTLLDVLVSMLRLEFAYARLSEASDRAPIEAVRSGERPHASVQPQQFGQALKPWLTEESNGSRRIPDPAGQGEVAIACFSLGLQHEGVLVTGSRRANFPTEVERLILRVAANQAGIGLQEARRSGEQKRVAEMLEEWVAERTSRLTAVNEELRRSEAYLAQAQSLSRTGSFGWKVCTGEIIWSDESFRIFEYEGTTKPTVELILQRVHPEDIAMVKQTIQRASQDRKKFEHEYRLLMPDGSIKYVHVVARPVSDELSSAEFVGAVMDVTDRKRAEEALLRSDAYLAEGQKVSHTGSWACDIASQKMVHSSEEHPRLFGLDPESTGTPSFEEFYQRIHPEDRERTIEDLEKAIHVGTNVEAHFRVVLPKGTTRYMYGVGHALVKTSGDTGEFVGTVMDVTERKRAEEERERLRQAQSDLAHINRVTTVGELTASLAHEVNQPIAAAVTDATTCLRWLNRDQPDIVEAREAALRVMKDATRAAEIVSRTRLLFKKASPQLDLVDVNEIIREMVTLLRSEAMRYSITVRTELTDLPPVMGDRVQLQQVLMNLVANGIDAMKEVEGTRELAIKSQKAENGQLLILVSDTDVGLPRRQEDQIFNAFFTTKPHGTGMGLRISRSIVESHGGHLWAADNSRCGASFYITLPTRLDAA
jgi:PAS domain S-box-containing protein